MIAASWTPHSEPVLSRRHRASHFLLACAIAALGSVCAAGCQRAENNRASETAAKEDGGEPGRESSVDDFSSSGASDSGEDSNQLREKVLAAMEAGEMDRADELARRNLAAAPQDPQSVFLMAIVLAQQNRFAEAIKLLQDLAADVPASRLPVMVQVAKWRVLQGRWLDAEEAALTVLQQQPDAVDAHRVLARLYTRQGRRIDAQRHLQHLARTGDISEAELLGLVYMFHVFPALEAESDQAADEDDELDPIGKLGEAHYELAADQWQAAGEMLRPLPDKNPAELALLGRIEATLQNVDALQAWSQQVPESAGITTDYWFALGAHLAAQGQHAEAVKQFAVAVVRDPTDVQAYQRMAKSLAAIGLTPQAQLARQRADQIQRSHDLARAIVQSPEPDLQQIAELANLLEALRRPFEALAWRALLLVYSREDNPALDVQQQQQVQQMLAEINRKRIELLQSGQYTAPRSFVLCGVTLQMLESETP